MTTARTLIDEAKLFDAEASPGPWFSDGADSPDDVSVWAEAQFIANVDSPECVRPVPAAFDLSAPNGAFIAAARTGYPALATKLEEASGHIKMCLAMIDDLCGNFDACGDTDCIHDDCIARRWLRQEGFR